MCVGTCPRRSTQSAIFGVLRDRAPRRQRLPPILGAESCMLSALLPEPSFCRSSSKRRIFFLPSGRAVRIIPT